MVFTISKATGWKATAHKEATEMKKIIITLVAMLALTQVPGFAAEATADSAALEMTTQSLAMASTTAAIFVAPYKGITDNWWRATQGTAAYWAGDAKTGMLTLRLADPNQGTGTSSCGVGVYWTPNFTGRARVRGDLYITTYGMVGVKSSGWSDLHAKTFLTTSLTAPCYFQFGSARRTLADSHYKSGAFTWNILDQHHMITQYVNVRKGQTIKLAVGICIDAASTYTGYFNAFYQARVTSITVTRM
jgi:hypothetical protein